jgi:hypothetical protein
MTYGWYFGSEPPLLTIFDFSTGTPRRIFEQNFAIDKLIMSNNILLTGYKDLETETGQKQLKLIIDNQKLELKTGSNNI